MSSAIGPIALAGLGACLFIGAAPEPARGTTVSASIEKMAFGTIAADVHLADVIEWANRDFVAHTVTARDGSFDVAIPPGATGRAVTKHVGRTAFFCRYHPTMEGVLNVLP